VKTKRRCEIPTEIPDTLNRDGRIKWRYMFKDTRFVSVSRRISAMMENEDN